MQTSTLVTYFFFVESTLDIHSGQRNAICAMQIGSIYILKRKSIKRALQPWCLRNVPLYSCFETHFLCPKPKVSEQCSFSQILRRNCPFLFLRVLLKMPSNLWKDQEESYYASLWECLEWIFTFLSRTPKRGFSVSVSNQKKPKWILKSDVRIFSFGYFCVCAKKKIWRTALCGWKSVFYLWFGDIYKSTAGVP